MLKTPVAADLLFSSSNFSGTIIDKVNDVNLKEFKWARRVPARLRERPMRSFVSLLNAHFGISYDGPDEGYRA
ncbi:MAG: hypothetical protein DMG46_26905 [Acidobacteria bacterium]|nr:MAG: hypothetical protein DMG46_26905 [Acidobacteriota bacterium]